VKPWLPKDPSLTRFGLSGFGLSGFGLSGFGLSRFSQLQLSKEINEDSRYKPNHEHEYEHGGISRV
jgi:hypothetical protein